MLTEGQRLSAFIHRYFMAYGLDYKHFLGIRVYDNPDDDIGEVVEAPVCFGDELNMKVIEKAALVLGLTKEELLSQDHEAAKKWYKKYPYFSLKLTFDRIISSRYRVEDYAEQEIGWAIFAPEEASHEQMLKSTMRVDYESAERRALEKLSKIDRVAPGMVHKGARIEDLYIETECFGHFEKTPELVRSYLDMVHRAEELFFKAWDSPLMPEEIREYNFLAAALGLQDLFYTSHYLYYDTLVSLLNVYRKEGYSDFFSYVRIAPNRVLRPWYCAEFANDRELAQAYVQVFPQAKALIRHHALSVLNYVCAYVWSDDEFRLPRPKVSGYYRAPGLLDPGKNPELNYLYIDKTDEEVGKDKDFAVRLSAMGSAAHRGGLAVPKHEGTDSQQKQKRMMSHLIAARPCSPDRGELL